MFEKIVPIEAWPPEPQRIPQVSGALIPKSVNIEIVTAGRFWQPDRYFVRATYTIELYTPTGTLVNAWTVKSVRRPADIDPFSGGRYGLGYVIYDAMTDAVTQYVLICLEQKEQITQWLSGAAHAPGVTP
jgi:hypothetical protein